MIKSRLTVSPLDAFYSRKETIKKIIMSLKKRLNSIENIRRNGIQVAANNSVKYKSVDDEKDYFLIIECSQYRHSIGPG